MEILQFIFVLLSFLVVIVVYLFNKINNLEKNNIENMTSVGSTQQASQSDDERIRELIREEYNHDIEAIRNLGAISQSLLTGKNYHNTSPGVDPGRLVIPADVEIQGKLKVNNHIEGNTTIKGNTTIDGNLNTTGYAEIGNAYIGKWSAHHNFAAFCHKDNNTTERYAIVQQQDGLTYVNSTNDLHLRRNNNTVEQIHANGATIGNAYIGKWSAHHDWAEFSHKDRRQGPGKYSFLSGNAGGTRINTHSEGDTRRGVEIRQDNDLARGIIEYAISRPKAGHVAWDNLEFGRKLKDYDDRMKSGDKLHCLTNVHDRVHADLILTTARHNTQNFGLVTHYSRNWKDHGYRWSSDVRDGVFYPITQ